MQNSLNNERVKQILEIEDQQNYFDGLLEIQEKYSQINFLRKTDKKLLRIWLSVKDANLVSNCLKTQNSQIQGQPLKNSMQAQLATQPNNF